MEPLNTNAPNALCDFTYHGHEEPVGTNFVKLFIHLIYFVFNNSRSVFYSMMLDWTMMVRHPFQTIAKIFFIPLVTTAVSMVSVVFIIARWFGGISVVSRICAVYKNSSLANCGFPDPLGELENNVVPGLDKMTAGGSVEFDFSIAKALLYFSSVVYEEPKYMKAELDLLPYPGDGTVDVLCRHYEESRLVALFQFSSRSSEDKTLIVSFRGTSMLDLDQWLLDANMSKTDARKYVAGTVHQGFYRALFQRNQDKPSSFYDALIAQIKATVVANKGGGRYRLYVTGHSLGAALASLFFARVTVSSDLSKIEIGGCYTFGCPRIGNLEFRNQYTFSEGKKGIHAARMYRVVNAIDPVVSIPMGFDNPDTLALSIGSSGLDPLDYCHIGTPIYLHPTETHLPESYPLWIPVTPRELFTWYVQNLLAGYYAAFIADFFVEWALVARDFVSLVSGPITSDRVIDFMYTLATQASMAADHMPSRYLRNLQVKERSAARHKRRQQAADLLAAENELLDKRVHG